MLLFAMVIMVTAVAGCRHSTPMMIDAAKEGDVAKLEKLIRRGGDVNTKGEYDITPLHNASWHGHIDIAVLLIRKGADVKAKDEHVVTPLHCAAENGHRDIVALLIEKGADVNAKEIIDCTPLHWAARQGHKDTAALLIEKGADLNAKNRYGWTPLDLAKDLGWTTLGFSGNREIVSLLRSHGAKTGEELRNESSVKSQGSNVKEEKK